LVVLVDRRRQGVIVGWIAGGEAVEAVHEDDRPVVGAASLLALFLAVLLAQMLVLGVQATALKPQRRQPRGQHAAEADHTRDGRRPDGVVGHR
jgi:hypothetical protein